ncbi:Ig-like domain-containing protein, partial [Pseudomonas sp. Pseusp88]|uniref:Ig-like domain-containing protein n=2 Tax=unclassified Pseudomonas TaxID=196821 RepID=UPI0039A758B6
LLAPIIFPAAALDGLTSDELEAMGNVLQGTIAGYNGMASLDRIQTFWNGRPGPEAIVGEDDMGLRRVMVDFSRTFLESIGDIEAPVHYTVTDLAGNLSMSAAPVLVKLQLAVVAPLPVPRVREAVGDVLDPANALNGATVLIDASANLRVGDRVVVNWQGVNASDSKEKVITAAEAGLELPVLFSSALVGANQGSTVTVAYVLHRANGVVQQSANLSLRVVGSVGLEFDTSPATLAGKVYLLPDYVDVLPVFPAGTTLHRVASGGRPPYTYRSSDERVAVVDGNGLTSVRGKGTATISVTDSQGASLSYPVTVTGVIHCLGLGGGKYTEIEAMAARHQARVPSLEEMGQIHSAYGNRWPMGHGYYWTSTVSHHALLKRMMQVKDLVTGAVPSYGIWDLSSALGVGIR